MQAIAGANSRTHTAASTQDVRRDADHLAEDLAPIEQERALLEEWKPQTKHTTWATVGAIGGVVVGGGIGASLGIPMVRSRDPLVGLLGLGVGMVGLIIGGSWGAKGGHSLLHRLDGDLPKGEANKLGTAHQRKVDAYETALDEAERAVRDATSNEARGDAWGELMDARPEGMRIPHPPKDAETFKAGDVTYHVGYGVVPSARYGT